MGWDCYQELKACHSLPCPQICTFFNIPHPIDWYHHPFITYTRNLKIFTGSSLFSLPIPTTSNQWLNPVHLTSWSFFKFISITNIYVQIRSALTWSVTTTSILVSLPPDLPYFNQQPDWKLYPFLFKIWSGTSSTWELVRNVDSQAPP